MRTLVRIHPDNHVHLHPPGLVADVGPRWALLIFSSDVRTSFEPHPGEIRWASNSLESQSTKVDGRHFESGPTRTSRRYEYLATPWWILNQALRGCLRTAEGRTSWDAAAVLYVGGYHRALTFCHPPWGPGDERVPVKYSLL